MVSAAAPVYHSIPLPAMKMLLDLDKKIARSNFFIHHALRNFDVNQKVKDRAAHLSLPLGLNNAMRVIEMQLIQAEFAEKDEHPIFKQFFSWAFPTQDIMLLNEATKGLRNIKPLQQLAERIWSNKIPLTDYPLTKKPHLIDNPFLDSNSPLRPTLQSEIHHLKESIKENEAFFQELRRKAIVGTALKVSLLIAGLLTVIGLGINLFPLAIAGASVGVAIAGAIFIWHLINWNENKKIEALADKGLIEQPWKNQPGLYAP